MSDPIVNPAEHAKTVNAVVAAAKAAGLDPSDPAVQAAMVRAHQDVVKTMPNSDDETRAHELSLPRRSKALGDYMKKYLPADHKANGGSIDLSKFAPDKESYDLVNSAEDSTNSTAKSSSGSSGTSASSLASDAGTAVKAYNTISSFLADGGTPGEDGTDQVSSEAPVSDATPDDAPEVPPEVEPGSKSPGAIQWIKDHPKTAIAAGLAVVGGVIAAVASGGAAAPEEVAAAPEALAGIEAATGEGAAAAPSAISAAKPSALSRATSMLTGGAKTALKGAEFGGAGALAFKALGGTGSAGSNPVVQAAEGEGISQTAGSDAGTGGLPATSGANPADSNIVSQINPKARAAATGDASDIPEVQVNAKPVASTFSNSQNNALDASTPVAGAAAGRDQAQKLASGYAADQTPAKLAAAQTNKEAAYDAELAGAGVRGDSAGSDSALEHLANLGQDNLTAQQGYGNNSLTQLNKTGIDNQVNAGAQIGNAQTSGAPAQTAVGKTINTQAKVQKDNVDFQQLTNALQKVNTFPSDAGQALISGTPAQFFAILHKQNSQISQADANTIFDIVKAHPELAPASGALDIGTLRSSIARAQAKNQADLEATKKGQAAAFGAPENPTMDAGDTVSGVPVENHADGGEVGDDEPDAVDSDVDDASIITKALGLKAKPVAVEVDVVKPDTDEAVAENAGEPISEGLSPNSAKAEAISEKDGDEDGVAAPEPGSSDIPSLITQKATAAGIDPRTALAIAKVESGNNPNAINTGNKNGTVDHGLFQINDSNLTPDEQKTIYDPSANTDKALGLYKTALTAGQGNEPFAIYAYNHGIGAAQRAGQSRIVNDPYVKRVLAAKSA